MRRAFRRSRRTLASTNRFYETCENEDQERDNRGGEAVDAERTDKKHLDEAEIKRGDDTDKRGRLEHAAQKSVEDDEFKRGKDKHKAVKHDAVFGEWDAEEARVLARRDDIAA